MIDAAYYNENDPFAARWLRNLADAGEIMAGTVDERSIEDVRSDDVRDYRRVHLFAGIAGWDLALRLAGWPDDRPVWTGSCPCQPYSSAGKRKGDADERNLWPHFFRLIRECRPEYVIGEQVESAIGHGWLDGICADLEGEGYAVGAIVLGAHSAGAPHIRQRLFWVADSAGGWGRESEGFVETDQGRPTDSRSILPGEHQEGIGGCCGLDRLGDPVRERLARRSRQSGDDGSELATVERAGGNAVGVADARRTGHECGLRPREASGAVGPPEGEARQRQWGGPDVGCGGVDGFWSDFDVIPCRDGKSRRTQPGLQCLVDGLPFRLADGRTVEETSRAGLLRGFGNAICVPTAAEFIRAYLDATSGEG